MDFRDVKSGPQADSLFDVNKYGCNPPPPLPTFTVRGFLRNAATNELIGDTSPATSVKLLKVGTTDFIAAKILSKGLFQADRIVSGKYVVQGSVNGFYPSNTTIDVKGIVAEGTVADLFLSPRLDEGSFRAVLSWAQFPADLDAHMYTPGKACEVYFRNKVCSSTYGRITLDYDVTKGYGPETISLANAKGSEFVYFVYIYSSGAYTNSQGIVFLKQLTSILFSHGQIV